MLCYREPTWLPWRHVQTRNRGKSTLFPIFLILNLCLGPLWLDLSSTQAMVAKQLCNTLGEPWIKTLQWVDQSCTLVNIVFWDVYNCMLHSLMNKLSCNANASKLHMKVIVQQALISGCCVPSSIPENHCVWNMYDCQFCWFAIQVTMAILVELQQNIAY